ncbi:unnamed protein product [Phaedon cochleariae]|uniref:Uncharacterized protein n=1 Tax=Phaedon cochleariae TaxID=80249 RepID=A0A9P0DN43_PHACE|nr:unnamed protein product [Phaedon cochleariae]
MNNIQKIEAVQAVIAILLPNYGTFLFYFQFHMNNDEIYNDLTVPSWTPSYRTFKLIWTCFYCIIGLASFLVFKEISLVGNQAVSKASKVILIIFYSIHVPACWAWLPLLGGLKNIGGAVTVLLLAGSTATTITPLVWYVNKIAAVLFLPHIAWIIFLITWTLQVS